MAHMFKQMHAVNEIDFETLTVEKLIDLVFTEMVYRKIQQLEEAAQTKHDLRLTFLHFTCFCRVTSSVMGSCHSKNERNKKDKNDNRQKMFKFGVSFGRNDLNLEGHLQMG